MMPPLPMASRHLLSSNHRRRIARSLHAANCRRICRPATSCTSRAVPARPVAARCARSVRTSPGFLITSPVTSRWSGISVRRSPAGAARAWCRARCHRCRSSAAFPAPGFWRTSWSANIAIISRSIGSLASTRVKGSISIAPSWLRGSARSRRWPRHWSRLLLLRHGGREAARG
jgi:hypothetical protein